MKFTYETIEYDIGCSQYPVALNTEIIQVKEKSASGIIYREDFSVRTDTVTYTFKDMQTLDYQNLLNFFLDIVNGTMETFMLTDDSGFVMYCNFTSPKLNFTKSSYELWNGTFTVENAS